MGYGALLVFRFGEIALLTHVIAEPGVFDVTASSS
jgi:hypothetical protein